MKKKITKALYLLDHWSAYWMRKIWAETHLRSWPSNSSDLNPIENMLHMIKNYVEKRMPKNWKKLWLSGMQSLTRQWIICWRKMGIEFHTEILWVIKYVISFLENLELCYIVVALYHFCEGHYFRILAVQAIGQENKWWVCHQCQAVCLAHDRNF